jgi:hypothetical protein
VDQCEGRRHPRVGAHSHLDGTVPLGLLSITDVNCLRTCRALKKLDLSLTSVTDAGILGLELNLYWCDQISDVSCLRSCRALTKLDLARTGVGDTGIRVVGAHFHAEDTQLCVVRINSRPRFPGPCEAVCFCELSRRVTVLCCYRARGPRPPWLGTTAWRRRDVGTRRAALSRALVGKALESVMRVTSPASTSPVSTFARGKPCS